MGLGGGWRVIQGVAAEFADSDVAVLTNQFEYKKHIKLRTLISKMPLNVCSVL